MIINNKWKSNILKVTYRKLYRRIFLIDYASSLNISLSDENVFGSWPSFSTFKAHLFFLWKFTNKGDGKKIQIGHMTVPNKEFPAAFLLDASGYPWSVGTVYFLNDCCRTNFFGSDGLEGSWDYSITKHSVIFFFSEWKNIVLSGVTLYFKQLKWHKVSLLYLWLNLYLVVSINRHSLYRCLAKHYVLFIL